MDKYSINYDNLESDMNRPKYYKYADVKDRLVKVAFDIVKFQDASEDIDGLWQIKATDDGEIIVAMYESPLSAESSKSSTKKTASVNSVSWEVIPARDGSMNIFYKGEAIKRVASKEIDVDANNLASFCSDVANKLNSDVNFQKELFKEVPDTIKTALFGKYPELTK